MDEEQIKKIVEDKYEDLREDSYLSMVKDFFSKKMRWVMIAVWVWFFIFMVPLIVSIIFFFIIDQTKYQVMCASIFIFCTICIGFLKVFAWVMVSKHNVKREIKRLELRIAELTEIVKNK